jgi:hypothetical protein
MSRFNIKSVKLRGNKLPWYIFNLTNGILITSPTIPTTIEDKKDVVFAESSIPGLNYTPLTPARNGNRKLSFSLPIIRRTPNGILGNTSIMASFEMLRNGDNPSLMALFSGRGIEATPNPKVIYSWGTHTIVPLEYFVRKCDFSHNTTFTTKLGYTEFSILNMELELDEDSMLYRADKIARIVTARKGMVDSLQQMLGTKGRPY